MGSSPAEIFINNNRAELVAACVFDENIRGHRIRKIPLDWFDVNKITKKHKTTLCVCTSPVKANQYDTGATEWIVLGGAPSVVTENQDAALSETKITQHDAIINISPDNQFCLATTLGDFNAILKGQTIEMPVRCTRILEKCDSTWKIVHFHKSVCATG